jgi:membrane associated rhomboid family serine protease
VNLVILLTVFGAVAYRITSSEERARYGGIAIDVVREIKEAATRRTPASEAFDAALRARARYPIATWAIAAIDVIVGIAVVFAAASPDAADTLVSWGASIGPRTTNGEWWRIATSIFLHTGLPSLIVSVMVLMQVGRVLERLVGAPAFVAVFLSAGASATIVNLSERPHAVTVTSAAAVFGLYGLLLASVVWQRVHRWRSDPNPPEEDGAPRAATAPSIVLKRLAIGGVLFFVTSAIGGHVTSAELVALIVGVIGGIVFARRATDQHAEMREVAVVAATAGAIVVACAIPLRHIADVKPEIARVLATEARTTAAYQTAFEAFKKGRKGAEALATLVERSIVPDLQAADDRLAALGNVPPAHRPLVADAREYLRLRRESWRLRADAIRRTTTVQRRTPEDSADAGWRLQAEARFRKNMAAMGNAESAERASLDAFERVRVAASAPLP